MTLQIDMKLIGAKKLERRMRGGRETVLANANRALRNILRIAVPAVKQETPRKTGKLAASTRGQVLGHGENMSAQIRQGAKSAGGSFYGHFVRGGTRAHTIVPVRARALRFVVGGEVVFATKVRHPGTKANAYHVRVLKRLRGDIDQIMRTAGAKITRAVSNTKGG